MYNLSRACGLIPRCIMSNYQVKPPFNHQVKLQIERYLDKNYQAIILNKFEALPLKADAAALNDVRHLTLSARAFFGGSNVMNEVRPSNDKDSESINSALRVPEPISRATAGSSRTK